jgi:hypothetical protein
MSALIEEFTTLVNQHDLTFEYSDDSRAWRRGKEQLKAIRDLAAKLPPGVAAPIWNAMVDRSVVAEYRAEHYWIEQPVSP